MSTTMKYGAWGATLVVALFLGTTHFAQSAQFEDQYRKVFDETPALDAYLLKNSSNLDSDANWSQPDVGCIESFAPQGLTCLDLSSVENPLTDLPTNLSQQQIDYWTLYHKADLQACRAKEVQARESKKPGSFKPLQIQITWMIENGAKNAQYKINRIYAEAQAVAMPPHILYGAIRQESLMADLGIASDGGNYSCGIAQTNIIEWCKSLEQVPYHKRQKMDWPDGLDCKTLTTSIMTPFYNRALQNLNGLPEYRLNNTHFKGIEFQDVQAELPQASLELQKKWFKAVESFLSHCSDYKIAIAVKAKTIKRVYDQHVPLSLKLTDNYKEGEAFEKSCRQKYTSKAYPLKTGWLLAVGMYNAGPRISNVVSYYFQMTKESASKVWSTLNPLQLIEALYWGGTYNKTTGLLDYSDLNGTTRAISWRKACVAQQHMARVIQHVTEPGKTIAAPLNHTNCFDNIPDERKKSSGFKK